MARDSDPATVTPRERFARATHCFQIDDRVLTPPNFGKAIAFWRRFRVNLPGKSLFMRVC